MHIFNPYPYGYIPCAPWSPAITPNYYGAYFTPQYYTPPSPQAYYCPPPRPAAYSPSTPSKRPSAYGGNRVRQTQPTTTRTTQNVHTAATQRLYHTKLRTLQTEEIQARSDIALQETRAPTTTQTARRTTQPPPSAYGGNRARQPQPTYTTRTTQNVHTAATKHLYHAKLRTLETEEIQARSDIALQETPARTTTQTARKTTQPRPSAYGGNRARQPQPTYTTRTTQNIHTAATQRLYHGKLRTLQTEEIQARSDIALQETPARTTTQTARRTTQPRPLTHQQGRRAIEQMQREQKTTQLYKQQLIQKELITRVLEERHTRTSLEDEELGARKDLTRIRYSQEKGILQHEEAQRREALQQQEATDFTALQQRLQSETERAYRTALHKLYEAEGQQRTEIAGQEASEHDAQWMLGFKEHDRISTHAFERGHVVHQENVARDGLTTDEDTERRRLSEEMTRTRPQTVLDRVIAHHLKKSSAERMIRLACQVVHDSLPWWIQDAAEKAAEDKKAQVSGCNPGTGIDEKHGIAIPKAQGQMAMADPNYVLSCITHDGFPNRDAGPKQMRLDLAALAENTLSKHMELCAWLRNTETVGWTDEQAAKAQWKELVGVIRTWYDYETNKKWLAYAHTLFPSRSIYDKDAFSAAWKEAKYDFHTLCQMVARRAHEKMEPPHANVGDISTQSEKQKRVLQTQEHQEWQALCHLQEQEQKKLAPIKIRDALKKTPVDIALIDDCAAHLSVNAYEKYPILAQIDMLSPYILEGGKCERTIVILANIQQVPLDKKAVLYAAAKLDFGFSSIRDKACVVKDRELHAACLCIASKHNNYSVLEACNVMPCVFHAINQPDQDGMTPLHYAAQNNNQHIVELLLEYDADPLQQNKQGQIPVDLCKDDKIRKILTQFRGAENPKNPEYPRRYYGDIYSLDIPYMLYTFSPYVLEKSSDEDLRMRMVSHQCLIYATKHHHNELLSSHPLSTPPPSLAPNGSGIYLLQITSTDREYADWFTRSEPKRRTARTYPILCDNAAANMALLVPAGCPPREELKYDTTDKTQDHPRAVALYSAPIFLCASSQGLIEAISFYRLPICCAEALRQEPLWQELLALADYYFPGGDLPKFLREQGPDTLSPDLYTPLTHEEREAEHMHTPLVLSESRKHVIKLTKDWNKLCNMIERYHNAKTIQEEKRAQDLYEQKYPGAIQRVLDSEAVMWAKSDQLRQARMNAIARGIVDEATTTQPVDV